MLSKFVILQTIVIGSGLGLYLMGWTAPLFSSGHMLFPAVILALALLANGMVAVSRSEGAVWLADLLPVVGLLGTVYGLMSVKMGLAGITDIEAHKVEIFSEVVQALACNFFGMLGYAWVKVTEKVCG